MEKYYLAALCGTLGLGASKALSFVQYFGSAEQAFGATENDLIRTQIASPNACHKFIQHRETELPLKIKAFCLQEQVSLLSIEDDNYPERLKQIQNPPTILYIKGNLPLENKTIGIVGSRKASAYGLKVAETFAQDLALAGLIVVSGGALGIDTAAHKGALAACKPTVAVMGCGLDLTYPAVNQKLFAAISTKGALVSEFPPGTRPLAQNFPARNRIINGLTQGIMVVEAAKKSGAMITAKFALEEGHDVYCVPGNIFATTSIGPHSLIKDGAKLVDRPEDILEDFLLYPAVQVKQKIENMDLFAQMSPTEATQSQAILAELPFQVGITLEEIVLKTALSLAIVSSIIINLQIEGIISEEPGQRYIRL
ncbi:MAG: DNA-processing protein DprA [Acidaminococcaceae bacterium]